MTDTPTVVSPELQPVVAPPVLHRTGNFEGVRAGWFGYKPRPDFAEKSYTGSDYLCRWEHCRDRVQVISGDYIKESGLWFSHRKNTGPNLRLFFRKLEKMLKVTPRSKFGDTENPEYCIWMDVSPWWMETLVRRSFLTLALRAGQGYKPKKENFLECFEKNKYGKESMVAIKLFLEGYTNYRGKRLHMFEGWSRLFRSKDETVFKKVMFKRKSKNNTVQNKAMDW